LGQFLGAHLSLKQSFENLEIPSLSRTGKKFVKELCRHVESGHALSSFFKTNDLISDQIILSTILIAEKTGHWDFIFGNLSEYIQKIRQMRSKIQPSIKICRT
jgi:type II secretory pathway component PulF